ncbi:MAG: CCA tRNA nucleotidyltransferase [Candidatus Thermoplasmatota archaeon]
MDLEKKVLEKISPTISEKIEIDRIVKLFEKRIKEEVEKIDINAEPLLVGSVAKGTFLKNPDIDIFILFPKNLEREKLEKYGLQIGFAVLPNGETKYAEHPYVCGKYSGYNIDIVPCYKIDKASERLSAVDRTPFHTKYIVEKMPEEKKSDVLLLKQFLKGIGVYGAEAMVQGFSGYLCELLVLKYGSFRNTLKNAKYDEVFFFPDPVDKNRNVASALLKKNILTFLHASKAYLAKPSIKFFFPKKLKPISIKELEKKIKERKTKIVLVEFQKPKISEDILYPQLRKGLKAISRVCEEYGFKIFKSSFFVNHNIFYLFEFETFSLPKIRKHFGPPVLHRNADKFLKKWKGKAYVEDENWAVEIFREYTEPEEFIKSKIKELNLGKNLNEFVSKGFKVLSGKKLLKKNYSYQLTKFFDTRFRWEY